MSLTTQCRSLGLQYRLPTHCSYALQNPVGTLGWIVALSEVGTPKRCQAAVADAVTACSIVLTADLQYLMSEAMHCCAAPRSRLRDACMLSPFPWASLYDGQRQAWSVRWCAGGWSACLDIPHRHGGLLQAHQPTRGFLDHGVWDFDLTLCLAGPAAFDKHSYFGLYPVSSLHGVSFVA